MDGPDDVRSGDVQDLVAALELLEVLQRGVLRLASGSCPSPRRPRSRARTGPSRKEVVGIVPQGYVAPAHEARHPRRPAAPIAPAWAPERPWYREPVDPAAVGTVRGTAPGRSPRGMSTGPALRSAAHSAAQSHPRGRPLDGHQLRHAQHLPADPVLASPPSPRPWSPTSTAPGPTSASSGSSTAPSRHEPRVTHQLVIGERGSRPDAPPTR